MRKVLRARSVPKVLRVLWVQRALRVRQARKVLRVRSVLKVLRVLWVQQEQRERQAHKVLRVRSVLKVLVDYPVEFFPMRISTH